MSNGQGGYNKGYYNYKSNPAMSYRNTDVANPQDQVYPQQQAARSRQADGVVDTSKKLAEINSKIENLNTRVYSLENHASSVAAATKQGQLPGKAIQNPKEQCKVIFTQEGLVEEEDQERVIEDFCLLLNDEEIVAAEAPGVQIDQPEVHLLWPFTLHHDKVSEVLQESTHQFNLLTSPTFLPKVKDQGKFTLPCTLGHLELDNALVDSGASINLISLSMAEKLGIAGALQRPTTSIMFGDATSKSPLGVFKNYHLKIGECIIQTDLTVMEMEEEKDLPLLLGTPFLSTVGASIDFHKQEVILHKVNSLVSYRLQPRGSDFCATIDNTLSSKSHEATKVVKERVDKEPRVGNKDKDERVDQGLRSHVLRGLELRNHDLIGQS
ncbi:unnamed protein product [Microthlaspi erraticum]|uniref:Uncharacterized protein n=1 Tax=Microthlaspi erraticum TaxID=1685480 RepID=A0A6D2IW08_9BRAS|nr:unnamed protein product [Microthlaspi erraticum]